jgi:hypothetical protein
MSGNVSLGNPKQVTIHTVLDEFREAATSNRDLGDKFESRKCPPGLQL